MGLSALPQAIKWIGPLIESLVLCKLTKAITCKPKTRVNNYISFILILRQNVNLVTPDPEK